jgi:ribosomal protein S27AE
MNTLYLLLLGILSMLALLFWAVVWREKKPTLKSLDQHTSERREMHEKMWEAMAPHPNRIACPDCGHELWDTNPTMLLASCPPKKDIHCPVCGYSGYRLA